jgi:hypothetical protein
MTISCSTYSENQHVAEWLYNKFWVDNIKNKLKITAISKWRNTKRCVFGDISRNAKDHFNIDNKDIRKITMSFEQLKMKNKPYLDQQHQDKGAEKLWYLPYHHQLVHHNGLFSKCQNRLLLILILERRHRN